MPEDNLQPRPQPSQSGGPPEVIQPASGNVVGPPRVAPQAVVASTTNPPTPMMNGQSVQQTSMSSSQFEQIPDNKSSKWRTLFIVLGVLQALGVVSFFLMIATITGQPGSEFIALALGVTFVPAVSLIGLVNLVGLPVYMVKQKPRGKGLTFCVLSLLLSLIVFSFGAYTSYRLRVVVSRHIHELSTRDEKANSLSQSDVVTKIQNCEVESLIIRYKSSDYPGILRIKGQATSKFVSKADLASAKQAVSANNRKCDGMRLLYENDDDGGDVVSAVSFDEAKNLLTTCKIKQVRMPMDKKYLTKTELNALDKTGIYEMEDFASTPFAVGFNESTRSKITPVARQAASQCKGMSFMLSPGHWSQSI